MKRKFIWTLLVFFLVLSSQLQAQNPKTTNLTAANSNTAVLVNMGCEGTNCVGLTIDATAGGIALTTSVYNPTVTNQPSAYSQAQRADCQNVGATIWVTTNPNITLAASRGISYATGDKFSIYGFTDIKNFKAIRDAGMSSVLFCNYYRQP